MALLEVNFAPSARDLRWFGVVQLAFFGLVGALVARVADSSRAAVVLWTIGGTICIVYYALPPLRRTLYVAWMRAVYPIGWVLSHALMAVIYFGVVTPIGWLVRAISGDPMHRSVDRNAPSYWVEKQDNRSTKDYFRQF